MHTIHPRSPQKTNLTYPCSSVNIRGWKPQQGAHTLQAGDLNHYSRR
jgi:hypothetical protein